MAQTRRKYKDIKAWRSNISKAMSKKWEERKAKKGIISLGKNNKQINLQLKAQLEKSLARNQELVELSRRINKSWYEFAVRLNNEQGILNLLLIILAFVSGAGFGITLLRMVGQ